MNLICKLFGHRMNEHICERCLFDNFEEVCININCKWHGSQPNKYEWFKTQWRITSSFNHSQNWIEYMPNGMVGIISCFDKNCDFHSNHKGFNWKEEQERDDVYYGKINGCWKWIGGANFW